MMERKLDFTAAWEDVVAMLKAHLGLVLPIAGVFIILPMVILNVIVPQPDFDSVEDIAVILKLMQEYFSALAPWFIGTFAIAMIGNLAIYHLVLGGKNPTVGEAISLGLASFLPYFLASLMSGVAIVLGMLLLFIPGLYLSIKFSMTGPAIAVENIKSPIEALSRSWALTKGNSLRILAFILVVAVIAYIGAFIIGLILGGILSFISPVLSTILDSILQGMVGVLLLFVGMAIYRQLAA
jgi:hypothetical protein